MSNHAPLKPEIRLKLQSVLSVYEGKLTTSKVHSHILDASRRVLRWALQKFVTGMLVDGNEVGRDVDVQLIDGTEPGTLRPAFAPLTQRGRRMLLQLIEDSSEDKAN